MTSTDERLMHLIGTPDEAPVSGAGGNKPLAPPAKHEEEDFEVFPEIPADLLRALNTLFPEQSPSQRDRYEDLMFTGGQRSVIRWLNREYEAQQALKQQTNTDV